MGAASRAVGQQTRLNLRDAIRRSPALSRAGLLERLFAFAFQGLVYPQIWEDPVVDMEALRIRPEDEIVAIASGSCNVLSYLTAGPARIDAVDLNGPHVALGRLKVCALRHLPDHAAFLRFFGEARSEANVALYDDAIRPHLDALSRAYWDARGVGGRRRIEAFATGFYRTGLLGRTIGIGHRVARLYGHDLGAVLKTTSQAEQREAFDRHVAPLFEKRLVRWAMRQPASLYGLGIPPAQYRELSGDGPGGIAAVLRGRLERLACDFDIRSNYFAWQAFGRGYDPGPDASLPPYLQSESFERLRGLADRVGYRQQSLTDVLATKPSGSVDGYVLLDAQDWMTDQDLAALWSQITRTARPGARVIFRTAATGRLLPGRVPDAIFAPWTYHEDESHALGARDRSAIYGAFHLYTRGPRRP